MNRPLAHLRRGLLGIAVAGSLGFGATQALASPNTALTGDGTCPDKGYHYRSLECGEYCGGTSYCAKGGYCVCF